MHLAYQLRPTTDWPSLTALHSPSLVNLRADELRPRVIEAAPWVADPAFAGTLELYTRALATALMGLEYRPADRREGYGKVDHKTIETTNGTLSFRVAMAFGGARPEGSQVRAPRLVRIPMDEPFPLDPAPCRHRNRCFLVRQVEGHVSLNKGRVMCALLELSEETATETRAAGLWVGRFGTIPWVIPMSLLDEHPKGAACPNHSKSTTTPTDHQLWQPEDALCRHSRTLTGSSRDHSRTQT